MAGHRPQHHVLPWVQAQHQADCCDCIGNHRCPLQHTHTHAYTPIQQALAIYLPKEQLVTVWEFVARGCILLEVPCNILFVSPAGCIQCMQTDSQTVESRYPPPPPIIAPQPASPARRTFSKDSDMVCDLAIKSHAFITLVMCCIATPPSMDQVCRTGCQPTRIYA